MNGAGALEGTTLIVRVLIGLLFASAGALKIGHFNDLAASIAGFRLLPAQIVAPLAVILPFFELGLGLYLIVGLFVRSAAVIAALLLAIYAAAIASAVIRRIPANCGCFGPQDQAKADWPHVLVDLSLCVICLLLAYRAPGALALERRFKTE